MKLKIHQALKSIGLALILLLAFSLPVAAEDTPPDSLPDLFSEPSVEGRSATMDRSSPDAVSPEVLRARTAEVDFSLLASAAKSAPRADVPAFSLNFFEDAKFDAYITRSEVFPSGAVGLVGTVNREEYNELVMVSQDGVLQAYLQVGEQAFEIRFTGDGHQIVEVDQSAYPESLPPVAPPQHDLAEEGVSPSTELDAGAALDSGSTIDVLVVYTAAARVASGGTSGIEAKIQTSILSSNVGYTNSGITQSLNLVGMEEVSYNENPSGMDYVDKWYAALDRLTYENLGYLFDARNYRETYSADLVFMVANITGSTGGYICGIGWVAGDSNDADYGYSVVNYNCTGNSAYTPQHEMGHNMGACHDWNNTSESAKPFCWDDYAYGYQQPDEFYTVMSYSTGCGSCTRINRWSNPNLTHTMPDGDVFPTSDEVAGMSALPDNARTLNETAYNVANWRQSVSVITGEFSAPGDGEPLVYPRTPVGIFASSSEGTISSVAFSIEYDGSYHPVGTDNDGSDGWEVLWNSSGVSEQNVNLKATVTDSESNTRDLYEYNVPFMVAPTSVYGYQARSGDGEDSEREPESSNELFTPTGEASPEPVTEALEIIEEAPEPVQIVTDVVQPNEPSAPGTIVLNSHPPRSKIHKSFKLRWIFLQ